MLANRIVQKNRVTTSSTTINLWGWGDNMYQLVQKNASSPFSSPVMSDQSGSTVTWLQISHGDRFTCAIDSTSKLWCWGLNTWGQLGNGNTTTQSVAVQIGTGNWNKVSCGTNHVLALSSSNKLFAWGRNNRGQLGDGTSVNKSSPVQLNSTNWLKISAGHNFSAAITDYNSGGVKGYLYTWGINDIGQLGDGTTTTRYNPVKVVYANYPQYNFSDVSAGYQHCLATMYNYSFFLSWGRGDKGQLGNGNTTNFYVPSRTSTSSKPKKIEACGDTSAFIDDNDSLYLFGSNAYGQLGNGNTIDSITPQNFVSPNYFSDIQLNAETKSKVATFAINTSGRLYSWGFGGSYILGNGSNSSISSPVQVGSANDWLELSITGGIGSTTMFALK